MAIQYRFACRRRTEAGWTSTNEVLLVGELGIVTDTLAGQPKAFKIGDGSTAWLSLPYRVALFAAASGTNTITATFAPKPFLYDGMHLFVRAAGANTGAVTFNPNSLGALAVTRSGGTALVAGDIAAAGHELILVYRSSVPRWELVNPATMPASALTVADAGGYFTSTNGEGVLQELGAAIFGGTGLVFVGRATVTGAAATTLTLSGLDLATDDRYLVAISLQNATGSLATISTFFNADATATNYDVQTGLFTGSSATAARANAASGYQMAATTGILLAHGWLENGLDGKPILKMDGTENITTAIQLRHSTVRWRTGSNVTDIVVSSSVASALAIGSYIAVWRVTG